MSISYFRHFLFFVRTTMYNNFLVFLLINQNIIIIILKKTSQNILKFLSFPLKTYFKNIGWNFQIYMVVYFLNSNIKTQSVGQKLPTGFA